MEVPPAQLAQERDGSGEPVDGRRDLDGRHEAEVQVGAQAGGGVAREIVVAVVVGCHAVASPLPEPSPSGGLP